MAGAIPWRDGESLTYQVKAKGSGRDLGQQVLTANREGDRWKLTSSFKNPTNSDVSSVLVDGRTLKPVSSTRLIDAPDGVQELTVTYTSEGALIRNNGRQTGLSVPEHAYDNDTSLFLWRTLPFADDYLARYVTIITNHRARQLVELKVTGREEVSVPAGKFTAWRLEIRTENAKQTAWLADTPSRPLVKYDNDRGILFELTSPP